MAVSVEIHHTGSLPQERADITAHVEQLQRELESALVARTEKLARRA